MNDNTSATGKIFASMYPIINRKLLYNGEEEPSRYGETKEILGFKTVIGDPISRCVGGQKRDINIFFLMAEAIWIWAGKSDVAFLKIFNSRMDEFSDDGVTFHAPYGFRLRSYNLPSDCSTSGSCSRDQIKRALELLQDKETRRCVLSIWNADYDLFSTKPTKDIPCNDLLMFKVRKNKLRLTVTNRSNDLHWGLPTNVFQFSFILEIMAFLTGTEVGEQQHNSDSLHIYTTNPVNQIHKTMEEKWLQMDTENLYDFVKSSKMDFDEDKIGGGVDSLPYVDDMFNGIITALSNRADLTNKTVDYKVVAMIERSQYFSAIYRMLLIYIEYAQGGKRDDQNRLKSIILLCNMQVKYKTICHDYFLLALNWFFIRLKSEEAVQSAKSEIGMLALIPELQYIDYSRVGTL